MICRSWLRAFRSDPFTFHSLRFIHYVSRFTQPVPGLTFVILIGLIAGCSSAPAPVAQPTPGATGSPTARLASSDALTPSANATVVVSPRVPVTSTLALTPTITETPTITATPTVSPTPGPPTPTLTPAPETATLEAAQNLDQALIGFAQAAASGDTQQTLTAQRKLLDTARSVAATANADQSPYGQQLRSALQSVQGAAAGNNDSLNGAHNALVQIAGATTATPLAVIPQLSGQPQQSLPDLAQSLRRAVESYNQALATGNQSDLLRAQRDLIDATSAADAATKNNRSPLGQQIQTALAQIHDGLGGDAGKFANADNTLAAVGGQNGAVTTQTAARVDLQPLQNDLDNKLQSLQTESTDINKDNVQKAEDALRQSIQKATDALASDHSPAADRFRDALGAAQTAASGDFTKIQNARDQLKAAVGQ